MEFQLATLADAEELSELDTLLFEEESFGPGVFRSELGIDWVLTAREGGRIVGYAMVRPGTLTDLLRLGVHPEYQRRGIARTLVEAARRAHSGPMMLFVRKENRRAQKLYEEAGFRIAGVREDSWLMLG